MRCYTKKLLEGLESGYAELRIFPACNHSCKRRRRYQKTLLSQQRANHKHSFWVCFMIAIENFCNNDWLLSITFSEDIKDADRLKMLKEKVIRFLMRKCNVKGLTMKYLYCWGRGDINENLHCHMLLNSFVSFEDLIACEKAYPGVHLDIKRIQNCRNRETDFENILIIISYMFKHWDSLTDDDKKMIGKRYYGSRSLNKLTITETDDDQIDRPIEDSPTKLAKAIAKATDFEEINEIIGDVFPGYRLSGYYYQHGGTKRPCYMDQYGQLFVRLELVKIGSKLDRRTS